ncbi:hypothetical protein [uncultured Gammaproteobacteria bacterium]|jgi:hypothetical protein|nr:hypothetical protein [uncultured Gammaproteobacteria bacterium]
MINNIVLIALLISITLPINANALTKIEQQEARLNHLNNLSYEIKEIELRAQRAELQKRCQKSNGCLGAPVVSIPIVNKKLKKEGEINSIKRTVTPNSRYAADGLSVIAILDNRVVFEGIDGFYEVGDFLSPEIQLKSIEGSKVTLTITTANNTEKTKTLSIDWIED